MSQYQDDDQPMQQNSRHNGGSSGLNPGFGGPNLSNGGFGGNFGGSNQNMAGSFQNMAGIQNMAGSFQNMAGSGIQNMAEQGSHAAREIKLYIQSHSSSEKMVCMVGGSVLTFISMLYMIDLPLAILHTSRYIVYCYLFLFGGAITLLNGMWQLPTQEILLKYFYFLHMRDGRAFAFCFFGCLLVALDSWLLNTMAGFFLFSVGLFCYGLSIQERRNGNHEVEQEVYAQM